MYRTQDKQNANLPSGQMKLEYCLLDDACASMPPDTQWKTINVSSTADGQRYVDKRLYDARVALIARRNSKGGLNLLVARSNQSSWGGISGFHIRVAGYLWRRYDELSRVDSGRVLHMPDFEIEDEEIRRLIVNQIAADVGMYADAEQAKLGAIRFASELGRTGLSPADWNIGPMLKAFTDAQDEYA